MVKINALGFKNFGTRIYIRIKKDNKVKKPLGGFLSGCGFTKNLYITEYGKENKDISDFSDHIENNKNENFDIDIIYCDRNIFIILYMNNDTQRKNVFYIISKYFSFQKDKKKKNVIFKNKIQPV